MLSTLSQKSDSSIFNFGDILSRLGNTAISALDQVAPVWLQQQLNLDSPEFTGTSAPTFQSTGTATPTTNLTSTQQSTGIVLPNNTLIYLGGGALILLAVFALKD